MPLHQVYDQRGWLPMDEDHNTEYVYRDGTLDQEAYDFYNAGNNDEDSSNLNENNISDECIMVLLKDLIVDISEEHDSPPNWKYLKKPLLDFPFDPYITPFLFMLSDSAHCMCLEYQRKVA